MIFNCIKFGGKLSIEKENFVSESSNNKCAFGDLDKAFIYWFLVITDWFKVLSLEGESNVGLMKNNMQDIFFESFGIYCKYQYFDIKLDNENVRIYKNHNFFSSDLILKLMNFKFR